MAYSFILFLHWGLYPIDLHVRTCKNQKRQKSGVHKETFDIDPRQLRVAGGRLSRAALGGGGSKHYFQYLIQYQFDVSNNNKKIGKVRQYFFEKVVF